MSTLSERVDNSLNETRMLILGAQVLLGFDYQGAFQPGFERLPAPAHELKVAGLLLMIAAVGLLIAPSAFHQVVEAGNDSQRLIDFTNRIASLALLPFAVAIGVDLYVASNGVLGSTTALIAGIGGSLFALLLWYGLELFVRGRSQTPPETPMPEHNEGTKLETKIKQVLTEARVILPGAQALLGFQFMAMLTDAFEKLPKSSQYVHLASLGLIAVCIVLLMAPAAFHRIVERGEDSQRLHTFSSMMVLAALVPLALGITGDCYVVLDKVLQSASVALAGSLAALVFFFGVWFGLTGLVRLGSTSTATQAGAALLYHQERGARAPDVPRR